MTKIKARLAVQEIRLARVDSKNNSNSSLGWRSNLRYTFGVINYSETEITFNIECYASPLRSRLDYRYVGPTAPTDYRGTTFNTPRLNNIKAHTNLGVNSGSDAYLDPGHFNSYNQVLTALRCLGTLEAIFVRLKQVADDLVVATEISATQRDDFKALLRDYIDCNGTTVTNSRPGPQVATVNNTSNVMQFITSSFYQDHKWYASTTEETNFDGFPLLS